MLFPRQIIKRLDADVVGQLHAKEALAVAAYQHQIFRTAGPKAPTAPRVLQVGPSGSGKTYIVDKLASILGLIYHSVDASEIVRAGIVGCHPTDIMGSILKKAGHNRYRAETALLHLDEFDKIAGHRQQFDVGGIAAQQSILKMIEGTTICNKGYNVRTHRMLIVCSGAFQERDTNTISLSPYADIYDTPGSIPAEWLIERGIIPELVGRLGNRVALRAPTFSELRRVLLKSSDSPLSRLIRQYAKLGIELTFSDQAIQKLLSLVEQEPTGSRALHSVCNAALRSLWILLPELTNAAKVHVDHDTIICGATPVITEGRPDRNKHRYEIELRAHLERERREMAEHEQQDDSDEECPF